MPLPQVVIVGRPNVGKSSLFNWLAHRRIAITDAMAGVTRDRLTHLMHVQDRYFELVDTGGIGFIDPDNLTEEIESQIQLAIDSATVVLFVVDAQTGPVAPDYEIDRRLRKLSVPVILVVNKVDNDKHLSLADEFYQLGRDPLTKVSVTHNRGETQLTNAILKALPAAESDEQPEVDATMKLAIVGRRNVGKSTFINTLAQTERMIVSEVAGTTRDSVDVRFELDSHAFLAIDTPGLRRRQSVSTNVDYFGLHRAQRSIRRADVTLLFFDAQEDISRVEKQLATYIEEQYKPCIFVVNKWDTAAKKVETQRWAEYVQNTFPTMWHVPIAFITGKSGKNVKTLINHAQMLFKQAQSRVGTPELNRLIGAAMEKNPPPLVRGRRGKIYYAAQVGEKPPTIAFFCNNPQAFGRTYRRYLAGVLHDQLEFGEVPIKIFYRKRQSSEPGKRPAVSEEEE